MSGLRYFTCVFCVLFLFQNAVSFDYGSALTKSLLYFEAQRSGKLPSRPQRVQWRGDSALSDGKDAGVDLVGGYYDAGDNVKFGLPMAFTVTMLAWSVVQFGPQLEARNELWNAVNAIKWGTDYLMKAHPEPNVLYGQVGDGGSDHACWQRPEDMTTPRPAYKIDEQHPGSDLAGETATAFAAASIAFKILKWPPAWLALATNNNIYHDFITESSTSGGTRTMFSWDDKYVGAQILISKSIMEKQVSAENIGNLYELKNNAEQYLCNCMQKGNSNVHRTNGGLLWFQEWNNLQYVTSASFIAAAYSDTLAATNNTIQCPSGQVGPHDLIAFAQSQVDYILGLNPKKMSYMVGFGWNYPKRVHHRGASIVSIKKDSRPVSCSGGFDEWFHRNSNNPNVIDGAVVGGPDENDEYRDERENYQQAEAATANVAPLVGVLARLASKCS
ncbi:glycosyl hydrolase 9B9 [Perilla frutescens var. hirtella]|nr:glycosyl hydrolase 9B9 [Perilla frutescens var. hirtella]